MNVIPYFVTAASIAGTLANAYQKRQCFYIWIFTNTFWCIYDIRLGLYSQSILYGVYLLIAFKGLRKWKK